MVSEAMLITRSLSFAYTKNADFTFPDIELKTGQHLLVLGKSGIGKTTLLHLMAGLLRPVSGSIEVMGTQLQDLTGAQLDRFRGKNLGLIFQQPHFIEVLSLQENLALVSYLARGKKDTARIKQVIESLGLGQKLFEKPGRMSQGERQRAAIAMAVVNSPKLILADEPTSNLDDENCQKVVALLKSQAAASAAQLIIITHDKRIKQHFQNRLEL